MINTDRYSNIQGIQTFDYGVTNKSSAFYYDNDNIHPPAHACPYKKGSDQYAIWLEGWYKCVEYFRGYKVYDEIDDGRVEKIKKMFDQAYSEVQAQQNSEEESEIEIEEVTPEDT